MTTNPHNKLNWFQARSPFVVGLSCVLAAGLFIWYKLRLVTGMPRSAYAVPEVQTEKPSSEVQANEKSPEDIATAPVDPPTH